MAARCVRDAEAVGSNPATPTKKRTMSKPGEPGSMRRYLAAAVLVRLADEGSRVVLVLLALQRTGSATVGGLIVAAFVFPHVVAAPWAGHFGRAELPKIGHSNV